MKISLLRIMKNFYALFFLLSICFGNANAQGLYNNSSAYIVANSGAYITLAGNANWRNDGTATLNSASTVKFNGNAAQEIKGSSSTAFGNLTVNNTITGAGGVTVTATSPITINGLLTLTDGHLINNTNHNLVLASTATVSPADGTVNSDVGNNGSFVSGYLDRVINNVGDWSFPMGMTTLSKWRPLSFTLADVISRTWTVQSIAGNGKTDYGTAIAGSQSLSDIVTDYYFIITPPASPPAVNLKLWYGTDEPDADALIGHWNASAWDNWTKNSATSCADWCWGGASHWVQVIGISSFSPVLPGRSAFPLPITLLSFTGECKNNVTVLKWQTASEINNNYFTVEKSADGNEFSPLTSIQGAGNSNSVLNYECFDLSPFSEISYYRLKQTDFDGNHTYSGMIAVQSCNPQNSNSSVNIYQAEGNKVIVNINSGSKKKYDLNLYDALGRSVHKEILNIPEGNTIHLLEPKGLATGIYFIALQNDRETITKKMFLK